MIQGNNLLQPPNHLYQHTCVHSYSSLGGGSGTRGQQATAATLLICLILGPMTIGAQGEEPHHVCMPGFIQR